jgi:hypothetical protein
MVFSLDGSLNSLAERLCLGVTIGDGEVMAFRGVRRRCTFLLSPDDLGSEVCHFGNEVLELEPRLLRSSRPKGAGPSPQRASARNTEVSSRRAVRRTGHIDRGIRRHLRCRDTWGLLPNSFAIYGWVV